MKDAIAERIFQLELQLLHTDWRRKPDQLESFLAAEFEEIGSNGQVSSRLEVIHWLLHKNPDDQWSFTNFRIKLLTNDLLLANYHAKKKNNQNINSNGSIRSSIWRRDGNDWMLVFHQATKQNGTGLKGDNIGTEP